jgi:hypothetical protein
MKPQPEPASSQRPPSDTPVGLRTPDTSSTSDAHAEPKPGQHRAGQQLTGQQLTGQQLTGQQLTGQQLTGQLSVEQVRDLLDRGVDVPLLGSDFPVPVRIDGRWWHLPDDHTDGAPGAARHGQDAAGYYRRSPPQLAAQLDRHARRLAAAARQQHTQPPTLPPP